MEGADRSRLVRNDRYCRYRMGSPLRIRRGTAHRRYRSLAANTERFHGIETRWVPALLSWDPAL